MGKIIVKRFIICILAVIVLVLSCSCGDTPFPGADGNQHKDNKFTEKPDSSITEADEELHKETDSLPESENNAVTTEASTPDLPEESEKDNQPVKIPMERFLTFGTFNGGVAWVGSTSHQYLIDTAGKALLDIDGYALISDFSNGYSHIYGFGRILTVDTSGNITFDLTLGENEEIVMVDGGYVFTREYVADFDSSGFEYKIYGPDGNLIRKFYSDKVQYLKNGDERDDDFETASCSYVGNDCIRVGSEQIYFIEDNRTVFLKDYDFYLPYGMNNDLEFIDGYAYIGEARVSKDDYGIRLVFMKETGEMVLITLPFDSRYTDVNLSNFSEGYCAFLYEYYDEHEDREAYQIVTIDLHNAAYNIISTEFDDKLEWVPRMCHKNVVIPMTGKDDEAYYALVNISGETILPPQKGHYYDTYIYNEDGTPIFDLEEKGFPDGCSMTNHNEGILLVSKIGWTKTHFARYTDEKGNELFDSIDVSGAKAVAFKPASN